MMPPKRTVEDLDPADREAVKRIHTQTFHGGATMAEALEAYGTHKNVDSAVEFLKRQHDIREAARFKERITAAAAKTLYAAAGLPEPSSDDVVAKPPWNFAGDMDLSEDELEEQKYGPDVGDVVAGTKIDMREGELPVAPQEQSGVMKYFPPSTTVARDVFGRAIKELSAFQTFSDADKVAATFKANAILNAAFKQHPEEVMQRLSGLEFMTFAKENPLKFRQTYRESVDRSGKALPNFTEAYPATTMRKTIKGVTLRLKYPAEDGTTNLRFMNVSACPLWSGKNGLHNSPDKTARSAKLSTLSPEEIHLGDYYGHKFCSLAPHQFTRFPELPLHVQDLVWEFSFEERVVEIQYDLKFLRIWSPTKMPAQWFVCKESNYVLRRVYEQWPFGEATAKKGLWFNFQVDVMFLTFEKSELIMPDGSFGRPLRVVNQLKVAEKFLHSLSPDLLTKIRHLGLDVAIWKKIQYDMAMLQRRRHKVYGMERLLLPMLPELESLHIIENDNVGCWRMNRRMIQLVALENVEDMVCSGEDLDLEDGLIRSIIGEVLTGRPEQSNSTLPRWWDRSAGVTYMYRAQRLGNGVFRNPAAFRTVDFESRRGAQMSG
ncbi:hypothetical protein ACLOAV_003517 [Pseudogymnoascus australis]